MRRRSCALLFQLRARRVKLPTLPTRRSSNKSNRSTASARCTIIGGRTREIQVWVDPDKLRAFNVTVAQVADAVRAQNMEVPGGRVDEGTRELTVRTMGRIVEPADFNNLVVGSRGDLFGQAQRRWLCGRRSGRAENRSATEWPAGGHSGRFKTVGTEHRGRCRRRQGAAGGDSKEPCRRDSRRRLLVISRSSSKLRSRPSRRT